jgi:hypothetical protein
MSTTNIFQPPEYVSAEADCDAAVDLCLQQTSDAGVEPDVEDVVRPVLRCACVMQETVARGRRVVALRLRAGNEDFSVGYASRTASEIVVDRAFGIVEKCPVVYY